MLKSAGQPGSVGQSAVASLPDWYILEEELIMIMERLTCSIDLRAYRETRGGSLDEHEAAVQ